MPEGDGGNFLGEGGYEGYGGEWYESPRQIAAKKKKAAEFDISEEEIAAWLAARQPLPDVFGGMFVPDEEWESYWRKLAIEEITAEKNLRRQEQVAQEDWETKNIPRPTTPEGQAWVQYILKRYGDIPSPRGTAVYESQLPGMENVPYPVGSTMWEMGFRTPEEAGAGFGATNFGRRMFQEGWYTMPTGLPNSYDEILKVAGGDEARAKELFAEAKNLYQGVLDKILQGKLATPLGEQSLGLEKFTYLKNLADRLLTEGKLGRELPFYENIQESLARQWRESGMLGGGTQYPYTKEVLPDWWKSKFPTTSPAEFVGERGKEGEAQAMRALAGSRGKKTPPIKRQRLPERRFEPLIPSYFSPEARWFVR